MPCLCINDPNALLGRFDNLAVFGFGISQGLFGGFFGGDVSQNSAGGKGALVPLGIYINPTVDAPFYHHEPPRLVNKGEFHLFQLGDRASAHLFE